MCTFLLKGALWDMEQVHYVICEFSLLLIPALNTCFWHTSPHMMQETHILPASMTWPM